MNDHRRRRWARVIAGTAVAVSWLAGGAGVASAETAKLPDDKVNPPVAPTGDKFDFVTICDPKGISLEVAKLLGGYLKQDIYQKDKPMKGVNGYKQHFLVFAASAAAQKWLNANPGKTVADAFKDQKFLAVMDKLKAAYDKLVKDGKVPPAAEKEYKNGTVTIWCVDGPAPQLGYYFTPTGKPGRWVGKCKFPDGLNNYYVQTDKDGNVIATQWMNYGIPDDSKDQEVNIYTYDPKTDILTVETKWGHWTKNGNEWTFGPPLEEKNKNGKSDSKKTFDPAPTDFSKLVAMGDCSGGCGPDTAVVMAELPPALAETVTALLADVTTIPTDTGLATATDDLTRTATLAPATRSDLTTAETRSWLDTVERPIIPGRVRCQARDVSTTLSADDEARLAIVEEPRRVEIIVNV